MTSPESTWVHKVCPCVFNVALRRYQRNAKPETLVVMVGHHDPYLLNCRNIVKNVNT